MAKFLVTYHGGGMPHDPELVAQVSNGILTSPDAFGGYSIIEATTKEDALKLLQDHPFVKRGGTLQLNQAIGV